MTPYQVSSEIYGGFFYPGITYAYVYAYACVASEDRRLR